MTKIRVIQWYYYKNNYKTKIKGQTMILTADIGNSNISAGIFEGDLLIQKWNLSSDKYKTEDEYGIFLKNIINIAETPDIDKDLKAAVISSVVLPLTEKFKTAIEKYLKIPVLVVSHKTLSGVILDVKIPKEVGCDRIANAAAAVRIYKLPSVVVDFGTATNFDVITEDARFIGGIISPGIRMSSEAFSKFTNLLPKLNVEDTDSVIGKNTVENMLSGIVIGHAAMIEGIIERIEEELGEVVTTIATGGYASVISKHLRRKFDFINPDLTLQGLKIIYDLNTQD